MLRAASITGVASQPSPLSQAAPWRALRSHHHGHTQVPCKSVAAPADQFEHRPSHRTTYGFYRVADRLFVGKRPDEQRLRELQALGVRHIVNLEDGLSLSRPLRRHEHESAARHGMDVMDRPMSPLLPLRFKNVAEVIRFMTNRDNQPLYVHCLFGQERALFLAALIRVYYDGWTPERAYREMRDYGYRPYLVPVLTIQYWRWSRSASKRAQMQPSAQRPSRSDLPPGSTANETTHPGPPGGGGLSVHASAPPSPAPPQA